MIRSILVAAVAAAIALPASAVTIKPVSVTSTSEFAFSDIYQPSKLIDGSGLSGGLHSTDFNDMFLTSLEDQQATLTFDLGSQFQITGASIWNYNFGVQQFASTLRRSVRDFTIGVSESGDDFATVFAGTLSQGTGQPLAAEMFSFGPATGRFVAFNILNNYASNDFDANDTGSGLSEVRFEGIAIAAAVPEPTTWATMILGIGISGAALRRRRRAVGTTAQVA